MKIIKETFKNANWYSLVNDNNYSITISNIGATVVSIKTPDKNGKFENIILGFDTPEEYAAHHDYFGATVARVAGRIADGKWRNYQLNQNEGSNTLHGGNHPSLSYVPWRKISSFVKDDECGLILKRLSIDGENGFPGDLNINAIFRLNNKNEFSITYIGHTSKQTLFNPTTHMYFNLSGSAKHSILNQELQITSDNFVDTDSKMLPTGNLINVDNTPFNFQNPTKLSKALPLMESGLDTAYKVVPSTEIPQLTLFDEKSGRRVQIQTSANSLVLFSTNKPEKPFKIHGNQDFQENIGLAIEPQMMPDAIHHSGFGNIVISPSKPMMYQNVYYL